VTPGMMTRDLASKNIGARGLTGQGEPGLHTLLGGGEGQDEASNGSSTGAAYSRLAAAHKDRRLAGYLAAVAAVGARIGSGGSGDNRGPSSPRDRVK
jgi:hypothetical protein